MSYTPILKEYLISNNVIHSHDAEQGNPTTAYNWQKVKTITIDTLHVSPTSIRTRFSHRNADASYPAKARIYKNGGAFGTERTSAAGDYTWYTYTEDLAFAEGDTLELWVLPGTDIVNISIVKEFRVLGTARDKTLQDALTDQHIGEITPLAGTNT